MVIPVYDYDAVQRFSNPFKGIKFSVKKNDVQVTVFSVTHAPLRQHLSTVISNEVYEIYGEKPLFSLLDTSLGVDVDVSKFCAGIHEKAVSMFMASVVLPINGRLTQVYRLIDPNGLLLVQATGRKTMVQLIFPSTKNIDTLDYVWVHAPESVIIEILSALEKVNQGSRNQ